MPRLQLTTASWLSQIPVELPVGGRLLVPRVQFRCFVRLPGFLTPRDAIIDTGSPLTWVPERIWSQFQPGIDFEWLPYPAGYHPPAGQVVGWTFTFRIARILTPLVLHDDRAEVSRAGVIAQFANGNPPPVGQRPAHLVIGLWGGVLEGTKLHVDAAPLPAGVTGILEF